MRNEQTHQPWIWWAPSTGKQWNSRTFEWNDHELFKLMAHWFICHIWPYFDFGIFLPFFALYASKERESVSSIELCKFNERFVCNDCCVERANFIQKETDLWKRVRTSKDRASLFANAMERDEQKNLDRKIFFLSRLFYIYSWITHTTQHGTNDRKGCFIIMCDLRRTIDDMIACIWFRRWCHSCDASFELIERIKCTNTRIRIHTQKVEKICTVFLFCVNSFFSLSCSDPFHREITQIHIGSK